MPNKLTRLLSSALEKLKEAITLRLLHDIWPSLGFALFGTVNSIVIARVPELMELSAEQGMAALWHHLLQQTVAGMLAAIVILVSLRLCTDTGNNMVRRPWRFIVVMLVITHLANLVGFATSYSLAPTRPHWLPFPLKDYVTSWLEILFWGSILAWLYFLYLQRAEDRRRFSMLLAKRALLARQISRSELLTARAQIDPELLSRILRAVHQHYPHASQEANALLDQLIAYLRMAMNRKRQADSSSSLATIMEQSLQTMLSDLATIENHYD